MTIVVFINIYVRVVAGLLQTIFFDLGGNGVAKCRHMSAKSKDISANGNTAGQPETIPAE